MDTILAPVRQEKTMLSWALQNEFGALVLPCGEAVLLALSTLSDVTKATACVF
jgi:hypothetical protein